MKWNIIIALIIVLGVVGGLMYVENEQIFTFGEDNGDLIEGVNKNVLGNETNQTGIRMVIEDFYKCNTSYDAINKILTNNDCLQFKTETNGVITINDSRYLAFGITGDIGVTNYKYTSMDFGWTWELNETAEEYLFIGTNDNPNFIWKQYYHFYKDPFKKMKIEHYLENNVADITNAQMYYIFNVLQNDTISYNGTDYLVRDYMGLYKQGNFNDVFSDMEFQDGLAFNVDDLINNNFTINEFYIGDGSLIGKPNIDIVAIGFTKNNGNFPKGSSFWIDPIAYDSSGAIVGFTTTTPIDVPYPATVNSGDILILHASEFNSNADITTPSGWTELYKYDSGSFVWAYYIKRADGTETGNLAVTVEGSSLWAFGMISRWTGVTTSDPFFEDATGTAQQNDDSMESQTITSTGEGYTAVVLTSILDDFTLGAWDGSYSEVYDFTTTDAGDHGYTASTQVKATAGDVAQETATFSTGDNHGGVSFFLIPPSAGADASPTVTLNSPADWTTYTSSQTVDFNCTVSDDLDLDNVTFYWNVSGSFVANGTNTTGINNSEYIFNRGVNVFGDFTWNCYGVDNSSNGAFASSNRTFSYHSNELLISDPMTASPVSVSSLDNITIKFNYSIDGVNQTSGVTMENVTIGGSIATIIGEGASGGFTIVGSSLTGIVPAQTTPTIDLPAGLQEEDLVIVSFVSDGGLSGTEGNIGSGYIEIIKTTDAFPGRHIAYKIMGVSPDSTVDIEGNDDINFDGAYIIQAWRGVNTSQVMDVTEVNATGSSGDPNAPSITPVTNGSLVVIFGFQDDDGSTLTSHPSGFTNTDFIATAASGTSNEASAMIASKTWNTGDGAVDAAAWVISGDDEWKATSIVLRPATGGGQQFAYVGGNWQVNVTVPTFASGLKDLFVNATHGGVTRSQTQTNAVSYGVDPIMQTSRISPANPYSNDTLIGYCNATDADNATVQYYWQWYENGALQSIGSDAGGNSQGIEINVANISSSLTESLDNWTLGCLASDEIANSSWLNSSVLIQNFTQTTCGTLDVPDSIYLLTENLSSAGTCFTIGANNVTLDCQNHYINYSLTNSGSGLSNGGYDFLDLKNCEFNLGNNTLTNSYGVYVSGGALNNIIDNVTITTTSISFGGTKNNHAIYFLNVEDSIIKNSNLTTLANGYTGYVNYGVYLNSGTNNTVKDNFITTNAYASRGISLGSSQNNILGNNITTLFNMAFGIYVSGTSNYFENNSIATYQADAGGDASYGIYMYSGAGNVFRNNNVTTQRAQSYYAIQGTGVDIDTSNLAEGKPVWYNDSLANYTFQDVNFSNYGQVVCAGCSNVTYDNVTIRKDGLLFGGTSDSFIINSYIRADTSDGVRLTYSDRNLINNSNISETQNDVNSLKIVGTSDYNNITNSYISDNSNDYTIYMQNSDYNLFYNNVIDAYSGYAVFFYGGTDYENFTKNTFNTDGHCFLLDSQGATESYFNLNDFNCGGAYVAYANRGSNTYIFKDNDFSGEKVYFTTAASAHVFNMTNATGFEGFYFNTETSNTGYVNWYLDAHAEGDIENVNVSVEDVNDNLEFNELTNSTGSILRKTLTEYFENYTGQYFKSNYTLNATAPDSRNFFTSFNLTENTFINIVFDTCTFSSGNWDIDCSDNCSITSNVDVSGANITINGTGTFTTSANITNYNRLTIVGVDSTNICLVRCVEGGCFH